MTGVPTHVQQLEAACRLTAIELFKSLIPSPTEGTPRVLWNQLLSVIYRSAVSHIGAATGRDVQPVTGLQLLVPDGPANGVAATLGHLWAPARVDRLHLRNPGRLRYFEGSQAPNWKVLTGQDLARVHELLLQHEPAIADGHLYLHRRDGALRRTQGSYYTPQVLVDQLLKTALDPVVEQALRSSDSSPQAQARALLSLRICDPACGAGALLLPAAKRLASHITRVREEPATCPSEVLGKVIENCLYGVDLDPLALAIIQASSWLETGHAVPNDHLVLGNALIGAPHVPVPPPPLAALPNDDRKLVARLKLRWRQVPPDKISCTSKHLADLWCAGFAWPHNAQTPPLTPARWATLHSNPSEDREGAKVLARIQDRQRPVHWHLRFPKILAANDPNRGFDVVLGNPPWERLKFQEKEYIATHRPTSAVAPTASQRRQQLSALTNSDASFRKSLEQARRDCTARIAHIRGSGRFPATSVGDLNAYTNFVELGWRLLRPTGRLGMVVPSGILTESTAKQLREDLLKAGGLVSAYEFENHRGMFPAVDRRMRFCLLTLASKGPQGQPGTFVFRARTVEDLSDRHRVVELRADEIRQQSPQTLQIPVFESQQDASLARRLHTQLPNNPSCPKTSWGLRLTR
ncbi:MAG: Eco57I restriction-modification methylase domain-containing protein, partial [Nannocystaceae bacterium]